MTADTGQKSGLYVTGWRFVSRHWYGMASGFLLGAVVGFAAPTLLAVGGNLERRALTWTNNRLGPVAVWPAHGTLSLFAVLCAIAFICAIRIVAFVRRAWTSWRAGLISGLPVVWFLASGLTFTLANITGSLSAVLILIAALVFTIATFQRDLRIDARPQADVGADPDEPISSKNQDILGRDAVVASIVRAVIEDRAPVVALTGAFGDGKTSVLNLLSNVLEARDDVICVRFSTWLPTDEKTLVSTLLGAVLSKLEKRFVIPEIERDMTAFTRLLFAVLPRIPTAVVEWVGKPSQDQRIAEMQKNLSKLPVRVVILLDDMDRMRRKELDVLFKLLRGVPEFPQFTYVCAFSRESVVQILRPDGSEKSRDEAEHFLEKFFPEEIPLPKIEDARLAIEFEKRFYAICDGSNLITEATERQKFKDDLRQLWEGYLKVYFSNLRRVKLFTNRLNRSLPVVNEEVNLRDFVLLEMVRMMNPVLYEEIFRNSRYFIFPQWRINTWLQILSPDEDEEKRIRKEYFSSLFLGLPRPPVGIVLALLKEIFPSVDAYIEEKEIPGRISREQDVAERERRIYHPAFFPRYFIFNVPSDLFSETDLSTFIISMNEKKEVAQCIEVFKKKYTELEHVPMKRWDFLHRVRFSIKSLNSLALRGLAAAISDLSEELEVAEAAGSFDAITATRIVFGAANRLQEAAYPGESAERAQPLLESIIRDATSDFFAVRVLNECISRTNRLLNHQIRIDKEKLEKTFRERMNGKYSLPGHVSPLAESANRDPKAIVPLGRWAHCGSEGQDEVQRYLAQEFRSDHRKIGRFLSYFFPTPEDARPGIDPMVAISNYFPLEQLRQLLNEFGDSSASSREDSDAIRGFRARLKDKDRDDKEGSA